MGAGLSGRETEVLELVAQGLTNVQVAERLGISPLTVKKHLERMYEASGVRNRAELVARTYRRSEGPAARPALPTPLTSFIGRERELAEVLRLLEKHRLVTLGGPGGIGKTRLALAAGTAIAERFADGVRLVELGAVADARIVLQVVASALGVPERSGSRAAALTAWLLPRRLLLVLDNCEHLVRAAADVVTKVLATCPDVRVLATSREALGIAGEVFWPVPPLSVPEAARSRVLDVAQAESVRLFVERAALRVPGLDLTADNVRAVAAVCRALDGMPLAIELAAARMSALSVHEIAARLDDRFRELRTDAVDVTPRHRTLRSVVEWSHQLLAPAEALLFDRLSVFAGGFTLSAAEAVCAGGDVGRGCVFDLVSRLIDKSFVIAEVRAVGSRYRLLETLQRFGRERLVARGERDALRREHATFFCALAEEAEPRLKGSDQLSWYERLEADHGNLHAALAWSLERDAERALRIAGSLWRFWDVRMYKQEGRRWLEAALEGEERASVPVRIKALNAAGNMAQSTGDYPAAIAYHERSLGLAREIDDLPSVARSLSNLGDQALNVGEHERARALQEEALRAYERLGDDWGVAITHIELGQVAYDLGELETAAHHYERGRELTRRSGDEHRHAHSIVHVGKVARERGDLDGAERDLSQALRTLAAYADTWMVTITVSQLACVATARGRAADAVPLFACAAAARRQLDLHQAPHWGRDIERWTAAARDAIGAAGFDAGWSAGETLPLDEAVSAVLQAPAATGRP